MIPKILHYCWFGEAPLDTLSKECMATWKEHCPEFSLMRWDDSTLPDDVSYLTRARKEENWANLSNCMRLFALHDYGGVYMDTDVELLKPLDPMLEGECFLGRQVAEPSDELLNNAIFGAVPEHPFVLELIGELLASFDGTEKANLSSPRLVSSALQRRGYTPGKDEVECFEGITIYPRRYFYPYSWEEEYSPEVLSPDTVGVHHWMKRW